jgi:type III secretion protein U
MAKGGDSGEKTELPTPKRLRDARQKGDVAKSKEFGTALGALGWLLMFAFAAGYVATSIADLSEEALAAAASGDFSSAAWTLGSSGIRVLLVATGMLLAPIAIFLTLAESLQIGPVFTTEKLKPSLDKMNPVEGLKRMFGKDGLVELAKSLAKAVVLVAITWMAIVAILPELGGMIAAAGWSPVDGTGPEAARQSLALTSWITVRLLGWTVAAFLFVAVLDRIWTKHSFTKRMKMSRRDVKQEHKSDEGDPHVKSHRRELHREWSSGNPVGAARGAAALLVNPTHIAIALDYDADDCPVPVVAAKGEGPLAAAMRAAATDGGVPIIRNVSAARAIWSRGAVGDVVPEDLFDAVAEVILWAKRARDGKAPMTQDLDASSLSSARG